MVIVSPKTGTRACSKQLKKVFRYLIMKPLTWWSLSPSPSRVQAAGFCWRCLLQVLTGLRRDKTKIKPLFAMKLATRHLIFQPCCLPAAFPRLAIPAGEARGRVWGWDCAFPTKGWRTGFSQGWPEGSKYPRGGIGKGTVC